MVSAARAHSMAKQMPSRSVIQNQTAEIRQHWSVGERHHRARLALLLQHRLLLDDTIPILKAAFLVDYVVLGGGQTKKLDKLPEGGRRGSNEMAFVGGERMWDNYLEQFITNGHPNGAVAETIKPRKKKSSPKRSKRVKKAR